MRKLVGILALAFVITGLTAASGQEVTVERVGDWTIERARDLFTDEEQAFAFVKPSQHPALGGKDLFSVGCAPTGHPMAVDGVTIMLLGSVFVADSYVEVERRVDALPPYSDAWFANRSTLAMHQVAAARVFLEELLDAERLALRYRGYSDSATYVFPVSGTRGALAALGCYTESI